MKQQSSKDPLEQKREKMHNQAIKSEPAAERKRTDGTITKPS
ncbi:hypothetical protein [Anaerosporomusa subterranea]|nr:hypothetical protein [Anaerosporomusa subterranea]